jgi:hypothetical protein
MKIGGIFRFWLIGTVLWITYWAYQYATNCEFTSGLVVCNSYSILFDRLWSAGILHNRNNYPWQTYWDLIECLIEIPMLALALGIAAKWVIRGFRSDP